MATPVYIENGEIPRKPDWFDSELAAIAGNNEFGKPRLRCVDGRKERCFRNDDPQAIKYPRPERFRHVSYQFRILNLQKGVFEYFNSFETFKERKTTAAPGELAEKGESKKHVQVVEVGRPCWIIEAFVSPDEINPQTWENLRYKWLTDASGVERRIDLIGAFPIAGKYVEVLPVVDPKTGVPIEPNRRILDEVRARWTEATTDTRSPQQRIADEVTAARNRQEKADAETEYAIRDVLKTAMKIGSR